MFTSTRGETTECMGTGGTEPYYLVDCSGDGSRTAPLGVIRKRGSLKYLGVTVIVRERRRILLRNGRRKFLFGKNYNITKDN